MVNTPSYMITVNGEDVTPKIKPYLASISVTDNHKNEADELTLSLSAKFQRPQYQDEIKVYLGYEGEERLEYFGLFHVESSSVRNNRELTINATGINFNSTIKQRVIASFDLSLDEMVAKIAQQNGLKAKIKTTLKGIQHFIQDNESDLAFLQRVAKEKNAVFNIKDGTIYFVQDEEHVPNVSITIDECIDSDIKYSNVSEYSSASATFQDTRQNKSVTATVGEGTPVLAVKGHWQSYEKAEQAARQALKKANSIRVEGSLTVAGRRIFAGSNLDLDGKQYYISKVTHTVGKAWKTQLSFNDRYEE